MRSLLPSVAHSFCNTLVPFVVFCGVAAAAGRRKADKSQPATAETVVINHQSDESRRLAPRFPLWILRMQKLYFKIHETLLKLEYNTRCVLRNRRISHVVQKTSEIRYTNWNFFLDRSWQDSMLWKEKYFPITRELKNFSITLKLHCQWELRTLLSISYCAYRFVKYYFYCDIILTRSKNSHTREMQTKLSRHTFHTFVITEWHFYQV